MLVLADRATYLELRKLAGNGEVPAISILVAPNPDAICASKILTSLLRREELAYTLRPTRDYEDLFYAASEEMTKQGLKVLFLINCGAMVDLAELLDLDEDGEIMIYVLDSHRPYNLHNLYYEHVRLIDDGTADVDGLPTLEQLQNDEELSDLESEDETEDESDDEEKENISGKKNGASKGRPDASKFKQQRRIARLVQRQPRTKLEKMYYDKESTEGMSYGTCVSSLMYEMASQVSHTNNELIWAAITGLTDQWVHGRIDSTKYSFDITLFQEEVRKFNDSLPSLEQDVNSSVLRREAILASNDRIEASEEFRFTLYRHWTIYDSMWHSQYVATRLGIWKENGQRKLDMLLARMGIPLSQAKEKWPFMDIEFKNKLRKSLIEIAAPFGLTEACYPSFLYQKGFKVKISAADRVQIVASLLEGAEGWVESSDAKNEDDDNASQKTNAAREHRGWVTNFWRAFDALATSGRDDQYEQLHKRGLELAIRLQKAIVRQAADIIEKRLIVFCGTMRYTILHQTPDIQYFAHPLALRKLAMFLLDYINERKKQPKPFMICARNEAKNTYLVVGATGVEQEYASANKQKNFGRMFREAAERTRARVCHYSFDSSAIEVDGDDIYKFVEFLKLGMNP